MSNEDDITVTKEMSFKEAMWEVSEETERLAEDDDMYVATAVLVTVNMKKGKSGEEILSDPEGIMFRVSCVASGGVVPPSEAIAYILRAASDQQLELVRERVVDPSKLN